MGIKDELLSQLPKLALMAMAGKAGGLPAVSAFMGGQRQGEFQQGQLQRQAMLDQRMLDSDARAAEMQQAQMANMETDNARLLQQDEMLKFQRAVQLMQAAQAQEAEYADDPIQADASVQAQAEAAAQAYGVPQERLSPFIQSTAPMISARKKKQAQALYERAEKRFNPKGENPEWESSITLQTGEQFGDVTPAQLRELFEAAAVDQIGVPALPPKARRALQMVDLGGKKMAIDPTQLEHGDTFTETPAASSGNTTKFWVIRNNKPIRITEAEYQPGDQPANTREQGRPVMSSDANRIIDLDASLNDLAILEQEISVPGGTGLAAKAGAALWSPITEYTGVGSEAKQRQATIDRVKQVIGKALEGGVLRKEDEYKYVKILPTIIDPPEVAAKKVGGLRAAIRQRRVATLEGLADAGFDTSKFSDAPASAPASADPDADPAGLFK